MSPNRSRLDFDSGVTLAALLGTLWMALTAAGTTSASPCYDCQHYGQKHGGGSVGPLTDPYGLVRGRCSYPCECDEQIGVTTCPEGVSLIRDGCGCCAICARQRGESCNMVRLCDEKRLLECVYPTPTATAGSCKLRQGRSCAVKGMTYSDGETFKLDCRTQCTCQNGTYGCVSLCPHESIRPSGKCKNPQLVRIHGACCRDWLCESALWEHREPSCARYSTPWSPCSSDCDPGLSFRVTNDNLECRIRNETRICQIRPCDVVNTDSLLSQTSPPPRLGQRDDINTVDKRAQRARTIRRRHVCRATVKSAVPTRLTDGNNCTSVKSYQAKYCAACRGKVCSPRLATTFKVDFQCPLGTETVTRDVMWIVKCVCENIR